MWRGLLTRAVPAGAEGTGFVFQDPTLMPWATVAANVDLPLRIAGTKSGRTDARVTDALHLVGLQDFAGAYPRELSGGMRMRVSIARAIVPSKYLTPARISAVRPSGWRLGGA